MTPPRWLIKTARWFTVIVILPWLGLLILMAVFQERFVFHPAATITTTPADDGAPFEDHTIITADGEALHAWWIPRPEAVATIVFFHGNGGNLSDRSELFATLYRRGFQVLAVDWRGYGRSTGSPSEQGLYTDGRATWTYVTETLGIPPDQVIIHGRSLGGGIATKTAAECKPGGLILEATFTSTSDVVRHQLPIGLPVGLLNRHPFASIERIGDITCPILVMHSPNDETIPYALGQQLATAAGVSLIDLPGGHNTGWFEAGRAYGDHIVAFAQRIQAADFARSEP
jgi:pimeloyl-ACP methyl ester carboxylesterase